MWEVWVGYGVWAIVISGLLYMIQNSGEKKYWAAVIRGIETGKKKKLSEKLKKILYPQSKLGFILIVLACVISLALTSGGSFLLNLLINEEYWKSPYWAQDLSAWAVFGVLGIVLLIFFFVIRDLNESLAEYSVLCLLKNQTEDCTKRTRCFIAITIFNFVYPVLLFFSVFAYVRISALLLSNHQTQQGG